MDREYGSLARAKTTAATTTMMMMMIFIIIISGGDDNNSDDVHFDHFRSSRANRSAAGNYGKHVAPWHAGRNPLARVRGRSPTLQHTTCPSHRVRFGGRKRGKTIITFHRYGSRSRSSSYASRARQTTHTRTRTHAYKTIIRV